MSTIPKLPTGFVVVTLDDLRVYGEYIPKGTPLEVERRVRADWVGSKLARDATDEELAAYRAEQAEAAAEAEAEAKAAKKAK